jgi:GNAT superfamily N-acetyltransferase
MTELFLRWQRGWAVARSLPAASDVDGVLRVRSMQTGRDVDYFAASGDAVRIAGLVSGEDAVTWLTMPATDPAALEAAGLVLLKRAEKLMTIELRAQAHVEAPDGYRLRTMVEPGPVITVEVRDESGAPAASGVVGLAGHDAVPDKIVTMPSHRRRGLAGAVMSALVRAAIDQGASTGLLVASVEGQQLYRALGWRPVSDVVIASTPGTVYPE